MDTERLLDTRAGRRKPWVSRVISLAVVGALVGGVWQADPGAAWCAFGLGILLVSIPDGEGRMPASTDRAELQDADGRQRHLARI